MAPFAAAAAAAARIQPALSGDRILKKQVSIVESLATHSYDRIIQGVPRMQSRACGRPAENPSKKASFCARIYVTFEIRLAPCSNDFRIQVFSRLQHRLMDLAGVRHAAAINYGSGAAT
jgi:hypothetical protein